MKGQAYGSEGFSPDMVGGGCDTESGTLIMFLTVSAAFFRSVGGEMAEIGKE